MSTLKTQYKFHGRCCGGNVLQPSINECIYYNGKIKDTFRFNGNQHTAKYFAYLIYHSNQNNTTDIEAPKYLVNTCNHQSCINPLHISQVPLLSKPERDLENAPVRAKRLSRIVVKEIKKLMESVDGKIDDPLVVKYCQENDLDISKLLKIQRKKIYSSIPG